VQVLDCCEPESDGRLNDAHARIVLPIELHTKKLTPVRYGELFSKFGKNRSTNYVTFLSTDAGRTDGRTEGWTDGRTPDGQTGGRLRDFIFVVSFYGNFGLLFKGWETRQLISLKLTAFDPPLLFYVMLC